MVHTGLIVRNGNKDMSDCKTCGKGVLITVDSQPVQSTVIAQTSAPQQNVADTGQLIVEKCEPTVEVLLEENLPSVGHLIFAESQAPCPVEETTEEPCDNEKYGKLEPVEETSHDVKPTILDWIWQCAMPVSKMVLLGRVKNKLARFNKSGWLKSKGNGEVEVVEELELYASRLLHAYSKPNLNTDALMGDPLNASFYTVGVLNEDQTKIKFYPQRGLADSDSIQVWNSTTKVVEHRAITDFPVCFNASLPELESGEILAIPKVCEGGDYSIKRPAMKLMAEGLLLGKRVKSGIKEDCEGIKDETVEYSGVALPTSDGCYVMTLQGCEVSFQPLEDKIKDIDLTDQIKTIIQDCIEDLDLKPETFDEFYNRTNGTNYTPSQIVDAMLVSAPRSSCKDCDDTTETP